MAERAGLAPEAAPEIARWVGEALAASVLARGRTAPNPPVGAVIVREGAGSGELLSVGWTQPPGQAHAEIHALQRARAAGHAVAGATMFVTLEPCCHFGRTPPCAEALIAAGIGRVVVGAVDPFPQVSGRGVARLRAAGIAVEVLSWRDPLGAACVRAHLGFFRSVLLGLPEVAMKAAITLDGRIASAAGESRWITGPEARAAGHRRRDQADAVLVGAGTALADDPLLDVRLPEDPADPRVRRDPSRPRPLILDSRLRTPLGARAVARGALILCAPGADPGRAAALRASGAEVAEVAADPGGRVEIAAALRHAAAAGLHRILAEGGAEIHGSLLRAGLVTEGVLFVNGRVLGAGPGFAAGAWDLAGAPGFRFGAIGRAGADLEIGLERDLAGLLPAAYLAQAEALSGVGVGVGGEGGCSPA